MELRHLRHFVAVAEELHFGRAAERLRVAQPAVSARIRRLEGELGVRLFERSSRGVSLTGAGQAFLGDARASLEHSERAARKARRAASGEGGLVRVGMVGCAAHGVLTGVMGPFHRRFPGVSLVPHEMKTLPQLEALADGRLDVGFLRAPPDDGLGDLEAETFAEEPMVAVLPAGHPLAGSRRRVKLVELAAEPLVIPDRTREPGWDKHVQELQEMRERRGFAPKIVAESSELPVVLGLVATGAGVTLLPSSARNLKSAGVVYRTLARPAPTARLSVAWSPASPPPAARAFLRFARGLAGGAAGRDPSCRR